MVGAGEREEDFNLGASTDRHSEKGPCHRICSEFMLNSQHARWLIIMLN